MVHARSSIYTALVTVSDHSRCNIWWEAVVYNPDLNLNILCKTQNSKSARIVHFLWVVDACNPPLIVHVNRRCTSITQYSLCIDYGRLMPIIQYSNKYPSTKLHALWHCRLLPITQHSRCICCAGLMVVTYNLWCMYCGKPMPITQWSWCMYYCEKLIVIMQHSWDMFCGRQTPLIHTQAAFTVESSCL